MTRKNRLNLPTTLRDKLTDLLGGKIPTTGRLIKLLDQLPKESPMLDQDDIDKGRSRLSPREHAEVVASTSPVPIAVDDSVAGAEASRAQREARGRAQVKDRIEAHRERGLDPNAPPEDPVAAAMANEAVEEPPYGVQPPAIVQKDETSFTLEFPPGPVGPPIDNRDPFDDSAEIERLKSEGVAAMRQHTDHIERRTLQRLPQILQGAGRLRSLEGAAAIMIAELQPAEQDAIQDVVRETGKEPWQIVLGAVALSAQRQELHAGEFDPDWSNRGSGATPTSLREQKCRICGGVLPSDARRGASACCNAHGSDLVKHTEGCSLSWLEMRQGRWIDTRGVRA